MFFHISKEVKENFPNNHKVDNFVINLDMGWHHTNIEDKDIWYKGYLDDGLIYDKLPQILNEQHPTFSGNFCVIIVSDIGVSIRNDTSRGFPIWYDKSSGVTNLYNIGQSIWSDSYIDIDNELNYKLNVFDNIGPIYSSNLSVDEVIASVDTILDKKIQSFLKYHGNSDPIRVFLSGGLDTALVFSYIKKHTDNYKLIDYSHVDYDYFYLKNKHHLSNFWGYDRIHHWKDKCILASGTPGDEFSVRSPTTSNLILLHYNTSIPELMESGKHNDSTLYGYFTRYPDLFKNQIDNYQYLNFESTIKQCCSILTNDYQHWHLGNTLTWTPLRDLEIFKLISRLEFEKVKEQIMDGIIWKKLIEKNDEKILDYLSISKNSSHSLENLSKLYFGH